MAQITYTLHMASEVQRDGQCAMNGIRSSPEESPMSKQVTFSTLANILVGLAAKDCVERGQGRITEADFVVALLSDQRSPVIRCLHDNNVDVRRLSDVVKSKPIRLVSLEPQSRPKLSTGFQEIVSSAICMGDRHGRSEMDSTILFLGMLRAGFR
jgi:ATP-dependent Clp protease ATP-binding subunit ClpA